MSDPPIKVSCQKLWKVFGPHPERAIASLEQEARSEARDYVIAVRDVSFEVRQGEIFVVMGLSGSGKSTLIRCLARLIQPSQGQILIDGVDMAALNEAELREVRRHKLSMVFQHFGLFPHRRVIDNVAYGLEVQGIAREERYARAMEVLKTVGLQGWEHHYPQALSGGMQQRVGLARALAVDPEILLFDEPFSALDPLIRREMQEELLALQKTMGRTLIFITHDFLEALKLGNHIAIMKDGAFVQVGTPQEIVARPVNEYVKKFTQDVPRTQVLTAGSVMQPLGPNESPATGTVAAGTTLAALLPLMLDGHALLSVLDEQGIPIGTIDRAAVLEVIGEGVRG